MVLVAENLTATDPEVARAVATRNPDPLRDLAFLARGAGARYLDLNLGAGAGGRPEALEFVLDALAGHWGGGLLIDSSNPSVLAAGARRAASWPGPVVLNGYSADPGREGVPELAARYGLDLVVLLMDRGIPRSLEERLSLAVDLVGRCRRDGVDLDRLWIDPLVAPLGWTDGQQLDADLFSILRTLPDLLGGKPKTLIGLSNLTTGAPGRGRVAWLEEVFLAQAAGAGLSHAMVNVKNAGLVRVARALEVFGGQRLFAPEDFSFPTAS